MALVSVFITIISGVFLVPNFCRQAPEVGGAEADSSVVIRCKGDNLTLYEPDIGVTVPLVSVFQDGKLVADSFVAASGQLKDRLTVKVDGRVTLSNLTSDDFGKYRVEVQLSNDRQIQRSLKLVIREPPDIKDGTLLVTKIPTSGDNSVRLTCGSFTSLGFPPVSVIWKNPLDHVLLSDGFKDQVFYLDLPLSSAVSGDYCCQMICHVSEYCCLDQLMPLRQCVPVHVQTSVTKIRSVDCSSLESLTHLQQQMLDLMSVRLKDLEKKEKNLCELDSCPKDKAYSRYFGHCMKAGKSQVDYRTAKANCQYERAHLVNIMSRDDYEPIIRSVLRAAEIVLPSSPSRIGVWTGANNLWTHGRFTWTDGSPVSSELWYPGEPNNSGNDEHCGELFINSQELALNDETCNVQRWYICEYNLETCQL